MQYILYQDCSAVQCWCHERRRAVDTAEVICIRGILSSASANTSPVFAADNAKEQRFGTQPQFHVDYKACHSKVLWDGGRRSLSFQQDSQNEERKRSTY
ncbi:hypothetical protein INR49_030322 [Caranx melampygus]|nr:hypothetical protein INR49_030322 [Caranx melampygus]